MSVLETVSCFEVVFDIDNKKNCSISVVKLASFCFSEDYLLRFFLIYKTLLVCLVAYMIHIRTLRLFCCSNFFNYSGTVMFCGLFSDSDGFVDLRFFYRMQRHGYFRRC